jgi:predicted cupin superfamily sugar epimerase
MTDNDVRYWVQHLDMKAHPEGGYFVEVYRSSETIAHSALPSRYTGDRAFCTSIFYLLEKGDFSTFHRIASDETLHFYAGGALDVHILDGGRYMHVCLGRQVDRNQHLQYTIRAGAWFAAAPAFDSAYSLIGCTVAPGFEFADFEIASRAVLLAEYPDATEVVRAYTRIE